MTRTPVTVSTPADLLPLVPHLFGYQPMNAVVVLSLNGQHLGACMVLGSDDPTETVTPDDLARAVRTLTESEPTSALIIGYETVTTTTAALAAQVTAALREKGLDLTDRLIVTPTSWRHADCSCCPADGNPLPADESRAARAYRAAKGTAPAASRAALRARLAPTERATTVERTCRTVLATGTPSAAVGILAWGRILGSDTPVADLPDHVLAHAALAISDSTLRDTLVLALCPGFADAIAPCDQAVQDTQETEPIPGTDELTPRDLARGIDRITDACADLPDRYATHALAVLSVTAWWHGRSALASLAGERALTADPGCRLAQLVLTALQHGMHPKG